MSEKQGSKKLSSLFKRKYIFAVYSKYSFVTILKYVVITLAFIGFIDMANYPTQQIKNYGIAISAFVGIFVFILFGILVYEKHILEWRKVFAINIYDCILQVMGWSSFLYIFLVLLLSMFRPYKLVLIFVLFLVSMVLTWTRGRGYMNAQRKSALYDSNIVDLKDLYENRIKNKDGVILLEERDVDYDLLNRKSIINHLTNIVLSTKPQSKFVISLEGKWGSGKTTILKNVKKIIEETDKDIVVIDDFDPWTYGTEESIVENFFGCIIKRNDLKMNTSEIKRSISVLANAIIDSPEKSNLLCSFLWGNRDANESKKQINEYLKLCGKRVVMYIDNLDRVEDDKIIFLFKLIGNVLDFDRVTYIISFDNEKVKKIFDTNLNIDYDYVKKIVQMQIMVPEVDGTAMENIVVKCTSNLIALYDKSDKEAKEYNEFITYIAKNIRDIRDFKRFINSVAVKALTDRSNLSKRDKIVIEYIRMNNYDLYKSIYNNRQYFISEDTMYYTDLWSASFSMENFNQQGKKFFSDLISENSEYKELLGVLFPYVGKYNKNQELKSQYSFGGRDEYQNIARRRGIASAKYFDLYFSETENQFSVLGGFIENFINSINDEGYNIPLEFDKLLKELPTSVHKEFFERIELYLTDIGNQSVYVFLCTIFNNIWKIDDSSVFMGLSARSRCHIIMWELIQRLSDEKFEEFLKQVSKQYDNIETVNSISYWFESDKDNKNVVGRQERWKRVENRMVSDIIDNDIDLYTDEYYHLHNIWALYRNLKDEKSIFQCYVKKRINRKNIFRMLYDVLGHSIGSEHTYYISSRNLKSLFEEEVLKSYMKDVVAETEDEEFLLQLYHMYLEYPNDERGDRTGKVFPEERILNI
ncbi:KAP family P-loop NTPase fold protein [Acetoanaerobium noterae]|uniref:KAP family P-loop NTPase fold protein n=1 Tax=Acetoanaerobium noterae TaxID=745369 RepID=UPI003242A25A